MSCYVCESSLDTGKGKIKHKILKKCRHFASTLYLCHSHQYAALFTIDSQSTTPKNWDLYNKNGIGHSPDPFFPFEYKRKKAVWQCQTTPSPLKTDNYSIQKLHLEHYFPIKLVKLLCKPLISL